MVGSWFTENFNDFSDEFFDSLGDVKLCDNVLDDIDPCDGEEDWEAKFQAIETPPLYMFPTVASPSIFQFSQNDLYVTQINEESGHSTKWPSSLSDVSGSKYLHASRTFSPVSVLDNNATLIEKLINDFPKHIIPVRRPRTKRSQNRRRVFSSIFFPARLGRIGRDESDSGWYDTKLRLPRSSDEDAEAGKVRRCTHCQVSNTPQWREGPMGPKTLCNACGVRYRSGRLYPEYRPAASPTFVPSQHSNSHRKVLEMRKKVASPAVIPAGVFADNFFS